MKSEADTTTEYSTPTYAEAWKAIHDRINWEQKRALNDQWFLNPINFLEVPDGASAIGIDRYLCYRVWGLGETNELATSNLRFGYERAKQALAANTFDQVKNGGFQHPFGKKRFLEAKILIDALYERQLFNKKTAIDLALIEAESAANCSNRYWNEGEQDAYQFGLELLLLTEAWSEAEVMINNARTMNAMNVKERFRAAKLILKHKGSVADEAKTKLAYRQVFDTLRNPDTSAHPKGHSSSLNSLFVMACIWQKFFDPGQGEYDYDKAIDLIWA
jgi:hypothetical protein